MENSSSNHKNSIKIIAVLNLILLNIITLGLYSVYWYVTRTKFLLGLKNRNIHPSIYLLAIFLACWQLFYIYDGSTPWLKYGSILIGIGYFAWIIYLSRLVTEIWNTKMSQNKAISLLNLYVLGHMYLQYKLNIIARSKNQPDYISNDGWINKLIATGATCTLILLFCKAFFINWHNVPTPAMTPTIVPGDLILSSRIAYQNIDDIKHGDIIIFKYPKDPSVRFVKRVIGKPGDKIHVVKNQVYLNEAPIIKTAIEQEKTYAFLDHVSHKVNLFEESIEGNNHLIIENERNLDSPNISYPFAGDSAFVVPKDSLFVMGDNRDNSSDSRYWGSVPFANIEGKALMVLWSINPNYNPTISEPNYKINSKPTRQMRIFMGIN